MYATAHCLRQNLLRRISGVVLWICLYGRDIAAITDVPLSDQEVLFPEPKDTLSCCMIDYPLVQQQ